MGELRESKKRETKQRISDVATELFYARGFDVVTVEEIAAAANVSKVTVFNYFARKETLFLDREDEVLQLVHEALNTRPKKQSAIDSPRSLRSAIDALRSLVDRLSAEKHPFARIDSQTVGWWKVVAGSPTLQARVREIGDEAAQGIAIAIGGPKPEGLTHLIAGMIVLTWRTAYHEAIRVFERRGSAKKANAAFLALIDRGFAAIRELAPGA